VQFHPEHERIHFYAPDNGSERQIHVPSEMDVEFDHAWEYTEKLREYTQKLGSAEGIMDLTDFDPEDNAFTGAILEKTYAFQRSQDDRKKRVTILGYAVDATDDIHEEMLEMIKAFPPKLLNQRMKETETAMIQGSTKHLSIKFLKDFLVPLRRIQECIAMNVDFVWRNQSEHSNMWKRWV
jgi:hypothetical protein